MTTLSSVVLNNEACSLIEQFRYTEAIKILQHALLLSKTELSHAQGIPSSSQSLQTANHCTMSVLRYSEGSFGQHRNVHFGASSPVITDYSFLDEGDFLNTKNLDGSYVHVYTQPVFISDELVQNDLAKAFALTFNLAITCHLQCIKQDEQSEVSMSLQNQNLAKSFYKLALEIEGVDKVFGVHLYAAVLNNLSAIFKLFEGSDSEDAASYDRILTRYMFLLIDTSNSFTTTKTFIDFMKNLTPLILRNSVAAAA
jgi:hypothetical protein